METHGGNAGAEATPCGASAAPEALSPSDTELSREMTRDLEAVPRGLMADVEALAQQPWTEAVGLREVTVDRVLYLGRTSKIGGQACF